jgi:hypothetical protein
MVVMQRTGLLGNGLMEVVDLVARVKGRGTRLVYDLDDDLLTRHPDPATELWLEGMRPKIRFLLREADLVTVSTTILAERLNAFNSRIFVWPNALDETLLVPAGTRPSAADIGYVGTHTHLPDLMSIVASLERVGSVIPGTRLELCGISEDPRIAQLGSGQLITSVRRVEGQYCRFHRMLGIEAAWKVGLAPLSAGQFNSAKSDIKLLDYTAAGIAAVVSDNVAYRDWDDGDTILRARNDAYDVAVLRLLQDDELRLGLVRRAREYLVEHRVLAVAVPRLLAALQQLLDD